MRDSLAQEEIMKRLIIALLAAALIASSCATMARWGGFFATEPYLGMSEADFRKAAPFLYTVNTDRSPRGVVRQYCFDSYQGMKAKYYYFENGKLVYIQE